jgi:hypothetical protein
VTHLILFRHILVLIVVLAGIVALFVPCSDPVIARRQVALRSFGMAIFLLAAALLTIAAVLPRH